MIVIEQKLTVEKKDTKCINIQKFGNSRWERFIRMDASNAPNPANPKVQDQNADAAQGLANQAQGPAVQNQAQGPMVQNPA